MNVETSWIGNSFGGANAPSGLYQVHVPDDIDTIYVDSAGNVYTNTTYDEAGETQAVFDPNGNLVAGPSDQGYNENGYAITANDNFIYYVNGGKVFASAAPKAGGSYDLAQSRSGSLVQTDVRGLAATDGTLYVSDNTNGQILIYSINQDGTLASNPASFSLSYPRGLALGSDGSLWIVEANDNSSSGAQVVHYDGSGNNLGDVINFDGSVALTGIAVDTSHMQSPDDLVLISDNGQDQDIKIYDVGNLTGSPTGYNSFGNVGGVYSNTKGQIAALKFKGLTGVGVDGSGNIYVSQNGGRDSVNNLDGNAFGAELEKYSPSGNQQWSRLGLEFVTRAGFDPGDDGQDVYDTWHHFNLNWQNNTPGSEWSYTGFTLDRFEFPSDSRLSAPNYTTWVRRINGNRILFTTGQYAGYLNIYKTNVDGDIATDSSTSYPAQGYYAIYPDANGGIWEAGTAQPSEYIIYTPSTGLDGNGNPTYGSTQSFNRPAPFSGSDGIIRRAQYDAGSDTLYLAGWNSSYPQPGPIGDDGPGQIYTAYPGWLANNGNVSPAWTIISEQDTSNYDWPESFSVAEKPDGTEGYLFLTFSGIHKIQVFSVIDGSAVGTITADPSLVGPSIQTSEGPSSGAIGNVDMPYGIDAFRRSNGEYVILNEEDNQAKNLLFRWVP
ncbi:hypothetical protein [Acidisarcina polymorpha]|uniref:hypothetical protein n=1 Tax=Acidisarcina polymorpha TaxID=2211140 RepID=UPI001237DE7C|nr:hypothetical protein [Acidisarcina polymorpha]